MMPLALLFLLSTENLGPTSGGLPVERIELAVRSSIAQDLQVNLGDVELPQLGLKRDLACPSSSSIAVILPEDGQRIGHVPVTVYVGGITTPCERLRLETRVEVWRNVFVSATDVAAGAPVKLRVDRVKLTADVNDFLPSEALLRTDLVARTPLSAGDLVRLRDVKAKPDALSGTPITLEATRGTLTVTAPGRLLADASMGDDVRALNLATSAVVRGVLVAPDRVAVMRPSGSAVNP